MNSRKPTTKALTILTPEIQLIEPDQLPKNPIFSLTTVNIERSLKIRRSVPKHSIFNNSISVPALPKPDKTPKPLTGSTKLPKKFSSLDWNDFLKRNIANTQKPSEKLKDMLNEIDSKINIEANSTQDTVFFSSVKKIDRSGNIEGQLNEIKGFTLTKKENFNEIHKMFLDRHKKYEDLIKALDDLEACDEETKKIEDDLESIKNYLGKVRNDLIYETYYSDTLRLMVKRSRDLLDKEIFPINGKNQDLFRINLDIKKEMRDLKQVQFEEKQLMKRFKKLKEGVKNDKEEKTQGLDFMLKIYEDQQRLKKYLEIEHKRHEMFEKTKKNNLKLLEFEQKIARLKKHNILNKEYTKLNKMLEHQERKFRTIQKVTNSSTIEDVLPHFEYLRDNRDNLETTLNDCLEKIRRLNEEKVRMNMEYNSLFTICVDNRIEIEIEKMRQKFSFEEDVLKKKEDDLDKLNQLILSSLNTLSRLVYQLSDDNDEILSDRRLSSDKLKTDKVLDEKSLKVQPSNINYLLGFCCIKIEKIMESIQSHQSVYYIESINTDVNYKSAPNFLKLLNTGAHKPKLD